MLFDVLTYLKISIFYNIHTEKTSFLYNRSFPDIKIRKIKKNTKNTKKYEKYEKMRKIQKNTKNTKKSYFLIKSKLRKIIKSKLRFFES